MIHGLRLFGIAAFALLAVGALASAPARASDFTASSYPTYFSGKSALGNDVFKTEAGSVECEASFSGLIQEASETEWVDASYTNCKAFGFLSASVEMGSCHYFFHASGEVDLSCAYFDILKGEWVEYPIVIVASTCEVWIESQFGLASVALVNGFGDILAQANVSGIEYNVKKDGFLCPFSGTGEKTGGTYTQGEAVIIESTSGTTIDIG